MGIATQRAMALGLLRNELLNPAALCASDPPRCPRAGAHSALVLSPITDGFEMECVWWGSMDSARSLPAVCPTEPVGLAEVWQKMGHNLSCSSALQKVGSTGRVSSTSTSLPRVPDMVTMAALPRPAWAQEHLWAGHWGLAGLVWCPGPNWSQLFLTLGKREENEVLGSATLDLLLLAHA